MNVEMEEDSKRWQCILISGHGIAPLLAGRVQGLRTGWRVWEGRGILSPRFGFSPTCQRMRGIGFRGVEPQCAVAISQGIA